MDATLQEALLNGAFLVIGAFVAGMITYYTVKGRNKADANKSITEAVMNLLDPLNQRVDKQEIEIGTLKKKVTALEKMVNRWRNYVQYLLDGIDKLTHQIIRAGLNPDWCPSREPPEDDEE